MKIEELFSLIKNHIIQSHPCHNGTYVITQEKMGIDVSINGLNYLSINYGFSGSLVQEDSGKRSIHACFPLRFVRFGKEYKHYETVYNYSTCAEVETVLRKCFPFKDRTVEKKQIQEYFKKHANSEICIDVIEFDDNLDAYYLSDYMDEQSFEKKYFEFKMDEIPGMLYKYISFETLVAIITSGNMRMNSVVGMNDKSEIYFTDQQIYCKQDSINDIFDSNRQFITSFSSLGDNLDMWRLYGGNTKGVCLAFKYNDCIKNLQPVRYDQGNNEEKFKKLKCIVNELNDKNIGFVFQHFKINKYFYKSKDYYSEKEFRLLVNNNSKEIEWSLEQDHKIFRPYLDFKLFDWGNKNKTEYPFKLEKIILGSNLPEKELNFHQLNYYFRLREESVIIEISKIITYR